MPLEHVCMWSNTHGWVNTTPSEAYKFYTHSVSSFSKQFMCEKCQQYVSFVVGKNNPHFKHPVGSEYCDEKTTSFYNIYKTNPLGFSLPLRIKTDLDSVEIFIGFPPVKESDMEKAINENAQLSISIKNGQVIRRFSINYDRFSSEHITYLSVGDFFSERYLLDYTVLDKYHWPRTVDGFNANGTLFDENTGKRLPRNANVEVGRNYLLFTKQHVVPTANINLEKKMTINGWKVYRVNAVYISKAAAEFFLQFGARLTNKAAIITHLWPPSVYSSHVLFYSGSKAYFYKTEGHVEIHPPVKYSISQRDNILFSVDGYSEKILTVSRFENRTSVLRYLILRPVERIDRHHCSFGVSVQDIDGKPIEQGTQKSLPPGKVICIKTDYDGFIETVKHDTVIGRVAINGGRPLTVEVTYNCSYRIYRGLDLIWTASFVREKRNESKNDREILKTLVGFRKQEMKIPHTFGAIAVKMKALPKTKIWLLKKLRQGAMSRQAFDWLKMNFGGINQNE